MHHAFIVGIEMVTGKPRNNNKLRGAPNQTHGWQSHIISPNKAPVALPSGALCPAYPGVLGCPAPTGIASSSVFGSRDVSKD
jgi:hypothetical protein